MTPQLPPGSQPLSCAALPSGGRQGSGLSWQARSQGLGLVYKTSEVMCTQQKSRTCACAQHGVRWRQRVSTASRVALLCLTLSRRLSAPFPPLGEPKSLSVGAEARAGAGDPRPLGSQAPGAGLPPARNSLHPSWASGLPSVKLGLAPIISEPLSKSDDLCFHVLIFVLPQKHSQTSRNGHK